MKKIILGLAVVAVAIMFASVAVAATSTSCSSCAKPCVSCAKPCATKACGTCVKPCAKPCATPCATVCESFKRDVLGNKIPVQTVKEGNALTDKATKYESTLVTGNM